MASSLVNGVPYKIFICLKSVDLPLSPAPSINNLILRDSAAQLWVSERESCDGGARVGRAGVDGGEGARACKENDAVAYLAVALAPAAVVGLHRSSAAHGFATWMRFWQRARARSRFFAARRLSSAVSRPQRASPASAGGFSVAPGQELQGAAQAGGKHSGGFPLARPREELLCLLFGGVGERDGSVGVLLVSYSPLASLFNVKKLTSNAVLHELLATR